MKAMAQRPGNPSLILAIRRWIQRRFDWQWFRGDYRSWAEARADAVGYDDEAILRRAVAAARAVRAGQATWERDGALFTEPAIHAPLLTALRLAAEESGNHLAVLDFGGALGSTWWQYRVEFAGLTRVDWRVVEQPAFVAAGRKEFTDATLGFYPTVAAACEDGRPNTLLLSSVLQYLEAPRQLLAGMITRDFSHIIMDRTSFARDGHERLVVQHTPPALGGGSYPCWIFDRRQMTDLFAAEYELVAEWPGFDDVGDSRVEFRGFHYRRKPHAGRV